MNKTTNSKKYDLEERCFIFAKDIREKDFVHRIKISRKEAKETVFWLKLIDTGEDTKLEIIRKELIGEATELMKIFSAIAIKSS